MDSLRHVLAFTVQNRGIYACVFILTLGHALYRLVIVPFDDENCFLRVSNYQSAVQIDSSRPKRTPILRCYSNGSYFFRGEMQIKHISSFCSFKTGSCFITMSTDCFCRVLLTDVEVHSLDFLRILNKWTLLT